MTCLENQNTTVVVTVSEKGMQIRANTSGPHLATTLRIAEQQVVDSIRATISPPAKI